MYYALTVCLIIFLVVPGSQICSTGGYRIAITDFGLATTEKLSEEFRTGSVYHMSPG
jgi:hypothetical protein